MKFLIWFLCFFANGLIITLIKDAGVILGAIPTMILYGATFWLARTLCNKWNEHKENKRAEKTVSVPMPQPTTSANQIRFCRKCGSELIDGATFCNKCGTKVVKE